MRAFDNGSLYSVSITAREVYEFKRRWPCSGLPDCCVTFQFNKRSGDLVDITSRRPFDGPAALALSEDAQAYGRKRLNLEY